MTVAAAPTLALNNISQNANSELRTPNVFFFFFFEIFEFFLNSRFFLHLCFHFSLLMICFSSCAFMCGLFGGKL